MVTEKMNRDAAIGLYCRLNKIDWDQEKVEQTDHFERWYATVKAALSTDAEPVMMGDEDRTPIPIGFDEALWRKADEVHHAMALVARDQECVKIIYAALSNHNAEPVKTAPAVAVKVKPLEWVEQIQDDWWIADRYRVERCGGQQFACRSKGPQSGAFNTLVYGVSFEDAKSAAQSDYETRILSALSAQVQDVAISEGWQLVPKLATIDMEASALEKVKPYHDISERDWRSKMPKDLFRLAWTAMLAAAPAAKQGEGE